MKSGFKYVAEGNRKKPLLMILLFSLIAIVSMVALQLELGINPVFFQATLMGSLVLVAYLFLRFIATTFIYEVMYEEDGAYFFVIKQQGRRLATQCKLPLRTLRRIEEVTPETPLATDVPHPILNYSSFLLEENYTVLVFSDGMGGSTVLRIHASAPFTDALRTAVAELRAAMDEEDDPVYDPAHGEERGTDGATDTPLTAERPFFSSRETSPFSLTEEELTPKGEGKKEE